MAYRWGLLAGSALGVLASACGDGKQNMGTDDTGVVRLQARAINAGSAATTPRFVVSPGTAGTTSSVPLAPSAIHTTDPSTFRVHDFISGPAAERTITI